MYTVAQLHRKEKIYLPSGSRPPAIWTWHDLLLKLCCISENGLLLSKEKELRPVTEHFCVTLFSGFLKTTRSIRKARGPFLKRMWTPWKATELRNRYFMRNFADQIRSRNYMLKLQYCKFSWVSKIQVLQFVFWTSVQFKQKKPEQLDFQRFLWMVYIICRQWKLFFICFTLSHLILVSSQGKLTKNCIYMYMDIYTEFNKKYTKSWYKPS